MSQKIFRANYTVLHNVIISVFNDERYANKLIEKEFRLNKKLGSRDRKFIAENVYDIVRWWRKLLYCCNLHDVYFAEKTDFTSKEINFILATWFLIREYDLPEFLKSYERQAEKSADLWKNNKFNFALKHSFADFFSDKLEKIYPDSCEKLALSLNKPAEIYLRCNTQNISRKDLVQALLDEDIEAVEDPDVDSCLRLVKRQNVFISDAFKKGYFEVQDKGSQAISKFLQLEPGQKVVDACAGAGGKSLHISDILQNKGRVLSLDIYAWKLQELKLRARRNKSSIIETRLIEGTKTIKRLKEQADRVLLDVPCSGSGVIRRNPDTKWKFDYKKLDELRNTQKEIITKYSSMLKPDGLMVYATCSIFPEENNSIVKSFLNENKDWQLVDEKTILPTHFNSDGFYMAALKKK